MVSIIGNRIPIQTIPAMQSDNGLGNLFDRLAAPLMNRTAGEINREKLSAMQRENRGIEDYARQVEGIDGLPNINQLGGAAIRGGRENTLADLFLTLAANTQGADSAAAVNAGVGAKVPMSSTSLGQQRTLANALEQTSMQQDGAMARQNAEPFQVLGADGVPVYSTKGEAPGQMSVTSLDQNRAMEYNRQRAAGGISDEQAINFGLGGTPSSTPRTDNNYLLSNGQTVRSFDGLMDLDGNPIPNDARRIGISAQDTAEGVGIGVSTRNRVDQQVISISSTLGTLRALREQIASAPASQGLVGQIRGTVQDVLQTGGELSNFFGGSLIEVKSALDKGLIDAGLYAEMFDESIPAIEMLSNLLAFQYAKIFSDRLSNEQVRLASQAIGGSGIFANSANSMARLNQLEKMLTDQAERLSAAGASPGITGMLGSGGQTRAPTAQSEADGEARMMQEQMRNGVQFAPAAPPAREPSIDELLRMYGG
jgi:hypothetical protein